MMDRRRFLLTSLAGAVAAPLAVEAQRPGKVYRVGLLIEAVQGVESLREGLRSLGYREGESLRLRAAEGRGPLRTPSDCGRITSENAC
jgi:hypothetical protein